MFAYAREVVNNSFPSSGPCPYGELFLIFVYAFVFSRSLELLMFLG